MPIGNTLCDQYLTLTCVGSTINIFPAMDNYKREDSPEHLPQTSYNPANVGIISGYRVTESRIPQIFTISVFGLEQADAFTLRNVYANHQNALATRTFTAIVVSDFFEPIVNRGTRNNLGNNFAQFNCTGVIAVRRDASRWKAQINLSEIL